MKHILILAIVLSTLSSNSQEFAYKLKLQNNDKYENLQKGKKDKLDKVLEKYKLDENELIPCYPNAKNHELLSYYTFKGKGNKQKFKQDIEGILITDEIQEEEIFQIASCVNPDPPVNDTWIVNNWTSNWALEMIEANCAWSVTHGSSNIIIGIADTEFENTHEDLTNQIIQVLGSPSGGNDHGTKVAGCASAQTNNSKGIAGIGYNSKVKAHCIPHTSSGSASGSDIRTAIWNLYLAGVEVINCSWTGTGLDVIAAEEITQSGIPLCLGAGNDTNSYFHSAIADIPGVLVISSVDVNNEHGPTGHAHNDLVDLCAPGSNVISTRTGNTYGGVWGTSYATPITAGTIALLRATNDCLTAEDIEFILESTADPIDDAASYPGLLGAGRLNAYEAVNMAQSYSNDVTINGTQAWSNSNTVYYHNINIASNGTLFIRTDIKIPDCAIITIDNGGQLIMDGGRFLNMANDLWKGTLIVNGILKVNSNFTYESDGSYRLILNGNIEASSGATITLRGISQNTTLAEVNSKIEFDTDFANITITDGRIQMNNSSAELYINSGVDNVVIDNVKVTPYYGTQNSHQGIDIRSNGNVSVTNSIFELGTYGLYASRASTASNITINNCTFKNCSYGFANYNSGVNISNSTFENNTVRGLYCSSMDKQSSVYNSTIRYQNGSGDYGLYYEGSSVAHLNLQFNNVYSNYYGVYVTGNFTSSLKCNTINNNIDRGIGVYNSDIYLAAASGITAGNNQVYSNKYAIYINGSYATFYLHNGYNDLRSDTYCMYGSLPGTAGGNQNAYNNYWKTGGGTPVSGVNYVLNGYLAPITLIDYSPENSYGLCSQPMSPAPLTLNTSFAPYVETFDYRTVETTLGDLPLNEAVNTILNNDTGLGKVYDIDTQYEFMGELLMAKLDDLNLGEDWYIKHVYNMFKSTLGKFDKNKDTDKIEAKLFDKMLKVNRKYQQDIAKRDGNQNINSDYLSSLIIDEATTLWYNSEYDAAIDVLINLQKRAGDELVCEIDKIICQINVDRAFIKSDNNLDLEKALLTCGECGESKKSGTIDQGSNDENESSDLNSKNINSDDYSLNIIPNPVSNVSEIRVNGYEGGELLIYNSAGQLVTSEVLNSDCYIKSVGKSEFNEGVYMVIININGRQIQSQKMVILK